MNKESWKTMNVISKQAKGRAPWLVAAVAALHVGVIGSVIVGPGCGTVRPRGEEMARPEAPLMPPAPDVVKQKPVTTPRPTLTPPANTEPLPRVPQAVGPTYTVEKGDLLSSIAHRYGVSAREIAEMNGIKDPNKIRIGQKLSLPAYARSTPAPKKSATAKKTSDGSKASSGSSAAAPVAVGGEYVVKSGDSLSRIAARNGTTIKALREANNLKSDALKINQKLVIPGKTAAPPAAAPAGLDLAPPPADPALITPEAVAVPEIQPTAVVPAPAGGAAPAITPVTPAAPAAGGADTPFEYTVKPGDTLEAIARNFGVFKEQLLTLNGLAPEAQVQPGQKIKIPMLP